MSQSEVLAEGFSGFSDRTTLRRWWNGQGFLFLFYFDFVFIFYPITDDMGGGF